MRPWSSVSNPEAAGKNSGNSISIVDEPLLAAEADESGVLEFAWALTEAADRPEVGAGRIEYLDAPVAHIYNINVSEGVRADVTDSVELYLFVALAADSHFFLKVELDFAVKRLTRIYRDLDPVLINKLAAPFCLLARAGKDKKIQG
jgi:hypothetical protein